MSRPVRVRFAPSPTGPLHIGGVRTALFNYLFAKKLQGTFYLRIEDTDQNRYVPGAEEYIFESLAWLGISPDETVGKNEKFGPYRQSERKEIYKQYALKLVEKGWAYYAFDTTESLDALRQVCESKNETFIYNWHNRNQLDNSLNLTKEDTESRIAAGEAYVIRFKIPANETLIFHDIIRGEIQVKSNLLDDKVLFKSDGMPTYHLANIVDDYLMQTSHVIRGEEWLPSLPLHILLYKAFEWEAPDFAHLPLILKPVGNGKLSKRDGDKMGFPVFPLAWKDSESGQFSNGYKESGYYPEAVVNFLALLGWNDGTEEELFTLESLISKFDLTRVNKSGAKFDPEKNKWFNHHYLINTTNEALLGQWLPTLKEKGYENKYSTQTLTYIIGLVKERATFVHDFWELSEYFFEAPKGYEEKASKNWKEDTGDLLLEVCNILEKSTSFETNVIEEQIKLWMQEENIGMGKVLQPLRLSIVGALKGPHLFDIIATIGREETIDRIKTALKTLGDKS
jgi:glutamyl-tRNA synthetase